MAETSAITGTREWADRNVNCCQGCANACLYCYGRDYALRFKRIATGAEWATERVKLNALERHYAKYDGVVMFPSTHDITPGNFNACQEVLDRLLVAGNRVLVVSKPRPKIIGRLCHRYAASPMQKRIIFRFTITHLTTSVGQFWEPNAPSFAERFVCLSYAKHRGYATSVSIEPLLEPERVKEIVSRLEPYVTDTIWIGAARRLRQRTAWILKPDDPELARVEAGQTKRAMRKVYNALKRNPKIRWKDSYREALGLSAVEDARHA